MKILTQRTDESVLCTLPNGDLVEVTMLVTEGEEYVFTTDVQEAVDILARYVKLLYLSLS